MFPVGYHAQKGAWSRLHLRRSVAGLPRKPTRLVVIGAPGSNIPAPENRIGTAITPDGTVTRVLDIPDDDLNLPCTVWSPDDTRLACQGWDEPDPSRTGIYTVRSSDGGDLVRLTKPPSDTTDVPGDYSPNGKKVLFKRGPEEADGT